MKRTSVGFVLLVFLSQGFSDDRRLPGFGKIEDAVTFRLYTRQNFNDGVTLTVGDKIKLFNSGFKGTLPVIVCTHGYFDDANSSWVVRTKQAALTEEDVNFITLDYSAMSHNLLYPEVVKFTKEAGLYTGQFLKFLQKEGNATLEKVHLIGHSLGAQVLGFASRAFPTERVLGRLTALDPAGPLYEFAPESERLNLNSAKLVDVIHTCRIIAGMKKPIGTIDFYPNGGYGQPGCEDFDLKCNHIRSREYFYESISKAYPNKYIARRCETLEDATRGSCNGEPATMGYYLNYSSPGIYYLKIN